MNEMDFIFTWPPIREFESMDQLSNILVKDSSTPIGVDNQMHGDFQPPPPLGSPS